MGDSGSAISSGNPDQVAATELDKLRSENRELAEKLADAQRVVAELNALLEKSIGRANALVLEAEISNLMLDEIFNSSHDAIWLLDRNFKVIRVNRRMASLIGEERQEIVGRRCSDVLSLSLCASAECALKRLLTKSAPVASSADVEVAFGRKERSSCILSATICYDPCGEVLGIVEAFTDITARKQVELALQRANEELERLSRTDSLTGLANRRHFDEVLEAEWARMRREKQSCSLLMGDVDFFKRYNDTYGHQAGDQCLASVARVIRSQLKRSGDLAARYGGEEFATILLNTPSDGAQHVAETIRVAVEQLGLPHSASSVADHVTISLGVASLVPEGDLLPVELIRRADGALYRAKEAGRNRSILYIE